MPGIVVIATRMPPEKAEAQLRRMVDSLRHEQSYETGTWSDEAIGIYVGWAARTGSFPSAMPAISGRGDTVLVFSGEDYSRVGRSCVNGNGRRSTTSFPAEGAEREPSFPSTLNGRFHGVLIDRSRATANIFNDRYGLHRLYWHETADATYFAAEAKAILAVLPYLRRLDPQSLGDFISLGCVPENRSLFSGIHVLPPASAWHIRNGAVCRKALYFTPTEWESLEPYKPEEFYQHLRETFQECLPRYFNGHESIGMSLTGGLDTRMIMAWGHFPPRSLPCYSFGGMFRECRDVRIARHIAHACQQSHRVISVDQKFLSHFSRYAERSVYLTDGCVRVTHSPDLYVNEIAARIAPVRMTGNYGGEILRGIRAFKPVSPAAGLFARELQPYLESSRQTYSAIVDAHPVTFAAFRQAPWHHYGLLALEQTQLLLRSPYLDNDLVRLAFRAPTLRSDGTSMALRLIADGEPALTTIPTDRGVGASILVRKAAEFTAKAEYACDYGMPQWLTKADHYFSPLRLDRIFLGRHKFYHFRIWYRDYLRDYVRQMLLDSRSLSRSYIHRQRVEALVGAHLRGTENHTSDIHTLLTLELIHRCFLDPVRS